MKAIYDYYNKNILPTLRLDEDALSLDYDAIEEFVKDGLNSGVFTGDTKKFDLVEGMNLEKAAELLGMTRAQAYAFFAELDKYNAAGNEHSFLSQLDDSLEGKITNITNDLEDLNRQKLALLEERQDYANAGDLDGYAYVDEQIEEINKQITQNEKELNKLGEEAYTTWQKYTQIDSVIAALSEVEDKTATLTEEGAIALGLDWDEVQGQTVQQVLDNLLAKQLQLEEPTVLTAQLAINNIDGQIAELETAINNNDFSNVDPVSLGLAVDATPEEIKAAVETKIAALKEDKVVIATTFGIELSEEEKASLQEELSDIEEFKIHDKTFVVKVNGVSETNKQLDTVKNALKGITDKTITLTTTTYDRTKKQKWNSETQSWEDAEVNGTAHVAGTAHANGSWGAPKTETALVGELGPEMLVRNGRWTTVGDNGAEFTQVKKGDIIFNHKQTKDLLSKGYVTGRGKLKGSSAFASGTAYSGLWNPTSPDDEQSNDPGKDFTDAGQKLYDASDSLSGAADDISSAASDSADEFREVFDWIEVRLEEINDAIDLKNAQLENKIGHKEQNKVVDDMIELNQSLYDNLIAGANKYYSYANKLLAKVPEEYRKAAQDGSIAIETFVGEVDEKTLEAIQEYRDWVQKGDDLTQQAEETLTEISALAKQAIDNIEQEYDNKSSLQNAKMDQLDAYNELAEAKYGSESIAIYEEKIAVNKGNIASLTDKRDDMQAELDKRVESGEIEKYSQDWYDAVNAIAEVDTEIINLQTDTENYQDAINEIHWEHFDNEINRIQSVADEADNLIDILSGKDMVDESGNWTDEGITTLGLYAQKMEAAEAEAKRYEEAIADLNANWQDMGYTEQEYLEKLDELKDGQYDAIKSYEDSKDAIVDLNKERVDAIKNGIEKEIEAYEELIKAKQDELSAEKDLHDFQKSVMDQQKDIADLERQLAALSGDNSASARAKRAQLEAELAEARSQLEETYYDRSISNQQEALDKELESFQEEKDKEMETLDEHLEDTEQVVSESIDTVQGNADTVSETLADTTDKYGVDISDSLTEPWQDGSDAIKDYSDEFGDSSSSTTDELEDISDAYSDLKEQIENFGEEQVGVVEDNFEKYQQADYQVPEQKEPEEQPKQEEKAIKVGGKINAGSAKIYDHVGAAAENQYYSNDPVYDVLAIDGDWIQVRHHSLKSGVTGWFKKGAVKAYARGSFGVDKDQWALLHELGDELELIPGKNGRLEYIKKGTGIVPADLTKRLVDLAMNPQETLDRNRPTIAPSKSIVNNDMTIHVDASVGELIHVERLDGNNLDEITKVIDKAWDKKMQGLNNSIRKFSR